MFSLLFLSQSRRMECENTCISSHFLEGKNKTTDDNKHGGTSWHLENFVTFSPRTSFASSRQWRTRMHIGSLRLRRLFPRSFLSVCCWLLMTAEASWYRSGVAFRLFGVCWVLSHGRTHILNISWWRYFPKRNSENKVKLDITMWGAFNPIIIAIAGDCRPKRWLIT